MYLISESLRGEDSNSQHLITYPFGPTAAFYYELIFGLYLRLGRLGDGSCSSELGGELAFGF